jgi:hypothetical protein
MNIKKGSTMKKKPVRYVIADWKENPQNVMNDTMKQVNVLLRRYGLKIYTHQIPIIEGPGIMIGMEKLTNAEAREISKADFRFEEDDEVEVDTPVRKIIQIKT